jgi:hypothetical protein
MRVFCGYSHGDRKYYEQLVASLSVLETEGVISSWAFDEILPGAEWDREIRHHLEEAELILFLVSKNFLASPSCRQEYLWAVQQTEQTGKIVIPVIISPCPWNETVLGRYQALPKDGVPIDTYSNQDEAWLEVYRGVKKVVKAPLTLDKGWNPWGGLKVEGSENTVVFSGSIITAGYVNELLKKSLAGKTLILDISNTGDSIFSQSRLLKMTVNNYGYLLIPKNRELIFGEYIEDQDGIAAYDLPSDFDGKLGFVFYKAELKNLKITAFYTLR